MAERTELPQLKFSLRHCQPPLLLSNATPDGEQLLHLLVDLLESVGVYVLSFDLPDDALVEVPLLLTLFPQVAQGQLCLLGRLANEMNYALGLISSLPPQSQPAFSVTDQLPQLSLPYVTFLLQQLGHDAGEAVVELPDRAVLRETVPVCCHISPHKPLHLLIHSVEQSLAIHFGLLEQATLFISHSIRSVRLVTFQPLQCLLKFVEQFAVLLSEEVVAIQEEFVLILKMLDCEALVVGIGETSYFCHNVYIQLNKQTDVIEIIQSQFHHHCNFKERILSFESHSLNK